MALPSPQSMDRDGAIKLLRDGQEGVEEWNRLRAASEEIPELVDADLFGADLRGANLSDADLSQADLRDANLSGANLVRANLSGTICKNANLSEVFAEAADFSGANLFHANLSDARMQKATFREADLTGADLSRADVRWSDLTGTILRGVNLRDSRVYRTRYSRERLRDKCEGARVSECYGNARFRRDVHDQDYIDALAAHLKETYPKRNWRRVLFRFWALIDYGRSFGRVAIPSLAAILLFALIYLIPGMVEYNGEPLESYDLHIRFGTAIYFSTVTYTTLGFGDVTPRGLTGEFFVVLEVLLGYLTLGLLVAILANKVARRA